MTTLATITINIDPALHIGPLTLAWHGLMIAVGLVAGGWLAMRYADEIGLSREVTFNLIALLAIAGIAGSRLLYLILNDAGALVHPDEWLASRGFAFYGALILGPLAAALYIWRKRLSLRYLDALAAGFPLGMAVGRIGDLINGEHYGPATTLPWGVRYLHPDAEVPSGAVAYHSGGLYEIVLALAMLAVLWPLRHRFKRPTTLLWTTVAAYSIGRFMMFFWRSDTEDLALGINVAQLTSLVLLLIALAGLVAAASRAPAPPLGQAGPSAKH